MLHCFYVGHRAGVLELRIARCGPTSPTSAAKFKFVGVSTDETDVLTQRWSIAVILATSLGIGACGGAPRSEEVTAPPNPEALRQNDRILQSIPAFPGAQLEGRNDVESPRGGKGAGSYLYYRTDMAERAAIVDHFKTSLSGWSVLKEETFPVRQTVTFVRGAAWFQVSAMDVTGQGGNAPPVPGYVVVVNARDAGVLTPSR